METKLQSVVCSEGNPQLWVIARISRVQNPKNVPIMKPEKPSAPAPKPGPAKPFDSLLDPLPLPEVVESDSDTAWGLWQDSLQTGDDAQASHVKDQAYDETAPMGLFEPVSPKKPGDKAP